MRDACAALVQQRATLCDEVYTLQYNVHACTLELPEPLCVSMHSVVRAKLTVHTHSRDLSM
jgi:hypothetical protein